MGRNEEQRGKDIPWGAKEFCEKSKSVLKAQKGIRAELQAVFRWGGWLTLEESFPEEKIIQLVSLVNLISLLIYFGIVALFY